MGVEIRDKDAECPECGDPAVCRTLEHTCEDCGTVAFGVCCGFLFKECWECDTLICTYCAGYMGWVRLCQDCTPHYMKGHEFDR